MLDLDFTRQEKKQLAGIYGFLVDVWQAQQSSDAAGSRGMQQIAEKSINRKTHGSDANENK